jgi:hypothetical protein
MCSKTAVQSPFAWYREFVPCEALRADVSALLSFVPGPALAPASRSVLREVAFRKAMVCAPQFADGQVSIRFEVGQTCDVEGRWRADSNAFGETVIGPTSGVGRTDGLDFSETVGVLSARRRVPIFRHPLVGPSGHGRGCWRRLGNR